MRYCVVDATQLFDAVRDKLEGRDTAEFCQKLIETEGILLPSATKEASAASAGSTE
jgi:hypothetical protein